MKKITMIIALFAMGFGLSAQKTVNLKINHKLGSKAFAFGQKSTNDVDNDFNYSRCEYYISKISIVHDGGKVSNADQVYALVNPSSTTTIDLGKHSITKVESINFSIGVDPGNNNADPTKWPSTHPLAPKNPSMHWGWAAGYRFVAIEGKAGSSLSTTWEVHALGNKNYFDINIPTSATDNSGALDITLNADYEKAVSGLSVQNGFTTHGEDNEAITVLRNFQNKVFTSTDGKGNTLSAQKPEKSVEVNLFPNPCEGEANLTFSEATTANVEIIDLCGRAVQKLQITDKTSLAIDALKTGMYSVRIIAEDESIITKKLMVN